MLKSVLIAGMGGFIGSALRFLLSGVFHLHTTPGFPWGTLSVNILGSFFLGLLMGLSDKGSLASQGWYIFLAVGICGGFTTFSTLSGEAFTFLQNREFLRFALYSGFTLNFGLLAIFAGREIIKMVYHLL